MWDDRLGKLDILISLTGISCIWRTPGMKKLSRLGQTAWLISIGGVVVGMSYVDTICV